METCSTDGIDEAQEFDNENPMDEVSDDDENQDVPSGERIDFGGTCFVVIDVDDNEENTLEKTQCEDTTGFEGNQMEVNCYEAEDGEYISDEELESKDKEQSTIERCSHEEKKCEERLPKEDNRKHRAENNQDKRKRPSTNNMEDKKYKRLRRSSTDFERSSLHSKPSWKRMEEYETHQGHRSSRNYKENLRYRTVLNKPCYRYSKFHVHKSRRLPELARTSIYEQKRRRERHHKREHSRDNSSDKESSRHRTALYINGERVHPESREQSLAIPELCSPVSDRSMSPIADFYRPKENGYASREETISELKKSNTPLQNIVVSQYNADIDSNICSTETKLNQTDWMHPMLDSRPLFTPCYGTVPSIGNNLLNNNFNRMSGYTVGPPPFVSMGFQSHPTFHYGINPPQANFANISVPQTATVAANCSQMAIPRTLTEVKTETFECLQVSADSINSSVEDIKDKVIPAIYKTMVASEMSTFSPEDVTQMMLENRPVRIEFITNDILLHLLKKFDDKFIVKGDESLISPKTDIKICRLFANDPSDKHDCEDLHICKYYLLGNCTRTHCKFSHRLWSQHNKMVLEAFELGEQNERPVKRLIRNLNSRNASTTPLICKFYNNEGGCQKAETCSHLHACTYFITGECKFSPSCIRSHNLEDKQPKAILEKYGMYCNGSDYKRIIALLKANLQEGVIKKRDSLKAMKVLNTDPPLTNFPVTSDSSVVGMTRDDQKVSSKPNRFKSYQEKMDSLNDKLNNYLESKQITYGQTGNKQIVNSMEKNLQDFIPLETESTKDLPNKINDKTIITTDKQLKIVEDEKVLKGTEILKEETPTEDLLLPHWTPIRPREDHSRAPITEHEQLSSEFLPQDKTNESSEIVSERTDPSTEHEQLSSVFLPKHEANESSEIVSEGTNQFILKEVKLIDNSEEQLKETSEISVQTQLWEGYELLPIDRGAHLSDEQMLDTLSGPQVAVESMRSEMVDSFTKNKQVDYGKQVYSGSNNLKLASLENHQKNDDKTMVEDNQINKDINRNDTESEFQGKVKAEPMEHLITKAEPMAHLIKRETDTHDHLKDPFRLSLSESEKGMKQITSDQVCLSERIGTKNMVVGFQTDNERTQMSTFNTNHIECKHEDFSDGMIVTGVDKVTKHGFKSKAGTKVNISGQEENRVKQPEYDEGEKSDTENEDLDELQSCLVTEEVEDIRDEIEGVTVVFEKKNDGKCFRLRKQDDRWQLQMTSTTKRLVDLDAGTNSTESVSPWINSESVDTEIVEQILNMFTGLVNMDPDGKPGPGHPVF